MDQVMEPQGARVLLVEDDEQLANLIGNYLSKSGLQVSIVADGAEVQKGLAARRPDLVILHQALSNRHALQVCRAIRATFAGPIVLLSAPSGWLDELVGLELGGDGYFIAPIEPRLLLEQVRSLLRRTDVLDPGATEPGSRQSRR
jgi:two-component system, OmpR family, response regulator RstA